MFDEVDDVNGCNAAGCDTFGCEAAGVGATVGSAKVLAADGDAGVEGFATAEELELLDQAALLNVERDSVGALAADENGSADGFAVSDAVEFEAMLFGAAENGAGERFEGEAVELLKLSLGVEAISGFVVTSGFVAAGDEVAGVVGVEGLGTKSEFGAAGFSSALALGSGAISPLRAGVLPCRIMKSEFVDGNGTIPPLPPAPKPLGSARSGFSLVA